MKLKSFTLVEFLVALVLSSCVFSLGWLALRGTQSLFLKMSGQSQVLSDVARFKQHADFLFSKSDLITEISQNRYLLHKSGVADTELFLLDTLVAIRRGDFIDRFAVIVKNITLEREKSTAVTSENVLKRLRFDIVVSECSLPVEFLKKYSAREKLRMLDDHAIVRN